MTRIFSRVIALLSIFALLVAGIPVTMTSALTYRSFKYTVLSDGTVRIDDYTGSDASVIIPDNIKGNPVRIIGKNAFLCNYKLESVYIPEGVTTIEDSAFSLSFKLREVYLPSTLITIEQYAFRECSLASNTFTIPENVQTIGDYAFNICNIQNLVIPASVTTIGDYAFASNRLGILRLSEGLKTIGKGAFYNSEYLKSVKLPDSVTNIGSGAFSHCQNLTSFSVSNNQNYTAVDGVLLTKDRQTLLCYPCGKTATHYTVPNSVVTVDDSAFYCCKNLTSVTLPDTVKTIGNHAFYNCGNLTSCSLPPYLETIGDYAFQLSPNIPISSLPETLTTIGSGAFLNSIGLSGEITIPDGVTEIQSDTFSGCSNLTAIHLGDNITSIGRNAFSGCSNLSGEITVPDGVTEIQSDTFSGCSNLTAIHLGDNITSIGNRAFLMCRKLTSIHLGPNITRIGESAFRACNGLLSVEIPFKVTNINAETFSCCYALESVSFPHSIANIGSSAFFLCNKLTDVYYKGTQEKWNDVVIDRNNNQPLQSAVYHFENEVYNGYADVKTTTWYYESVLYVTVNNFMTGYQNGKFGPADNLQRQDFVVALARIAGADLTAYQGQTGNLSDVKANSYYAAAVAWAVDNGIITGYQDGRFGVGDTITREQVCTIFYRYMNSPAVENVDSTLSVFPDKAHVSGFAKTPMAWAIDNDIVSGMQNGHLAPTAGASRAQIATIIMRMDQSGMFA